MRSRWMRSFVALCVVAALGSTAQPAYGATVFTVQFVAVMVLAGPLGDPCVGPNGTVDLLLCPTTYMNMHPTNGDFNPTPLAVTNLPLPNDPVPQGHVDYHHNKTTINQFGSILCTNQAVNFNKAGKAPTHAGNCSFAIDPTPKPGGNTVAGDCTQMSGQLELFYNDALGQTFHFDVHFTGAVEKLVFTGHFTKLTGGQRGLLRVFANEGWRLMGRTR